MRRRLSSAFFVCASARCTAASAAWTAERCPSIRRRVTSISPSSAATSARARSSAYSYGRGSMTNRSSSCLTDWLSATWRALIVPLTCGTTSMMSAMTIASSVCGFRTMRRTTTIPSTTAPTTRPGTTSRPRVGRVPLTSAPEHEKPGGEDEKTGQAQVGECRGTKVGSCARRDEPPPDDHSEQQADHDADQPRREERTENAHRGCHESRDEMDPPARVVEWPLATVRSGRQASDRYPRSPALGNGPTVTTAEDPRNDCGGLRHGEEARGSTRFFGANRDRRERTPGEHAEPARALPTFERGDALGR